MLHYTLITAQIVVFIVLGILLWQVWHFFKRKDIPDDEPLSEERAKYIKHKLTTIGICAIVEAILQIASTILRFLEAI